jgi:hypothetical protein
MPITSNGQTVKGLYGGYRAGQKDEQQYRGKEANIESVEISNVAKQAEFMEWLDRRETRDVLATEAESTARTTIETEKERTKAKRAELEAEEETSRLQEETAEAQRKLVDKKAELEEESLDMKFREYRKKIRDEDMEQIIGTVSQLDEVLESGQADPQQAYQQTVNALIYSHPEGAQYAAEMLKDMGIDYNYSPQSLEQLRAFSSKAVHDKQTVQTEHLMRQEWLMEIELNKLKAKSKGLKPSDLFTKPPTRDQVNQVGDRLSVIEEFDDLQGHWDEEGKRYTKDQGALASSISDISWQAAMNQKAGDYTSPGEFQMIAIDIFKDLNRYFVEEGTVTDDIKLQEYNKQTRLAISRTMLARDTWMSDEGEVPDVIHVWAIHKNEIMSNIEDAMLAQQGE